MSQKFKVGDRVRFNTKDPLYSDPSCRMDWKSIGLDARKTYVVSEIISNVLINIKGINFDAGTHVSWWIKVPSKKVKVRKKYTKFVDKLMEIK